ncbi:MAG: TlpA disulfide reductase family protein [Candidatus Xenobia bacterium]
MGLKPKVSTLVRALALAALIVAIGIGASQANTKQDWPKGPIDFKAKDLEGKPVTFSSLKARLFVVDIWATWCPPCREELPDLVALSNQYKSQGVQFLGIATDDEGASVVKPFVQKNQITYPIWLGQDDVMKAFGGVEGFPTTFFIGPDHKIRHRFEGFHSKADFEKQIQKLLGGTSR